MLTKHDEATVGQTAAVPASRPIMANETGGKIMSESGRGRSRLVRALRIEWLGQTAASLCWIASVLTYGITSAGDWLQLCAASAWLLANMAAIASAEDD